MSSYYQIIAVQTAHFVLPQTSYVTLLINSIMQDSGTGTVVGNGDYNGDGSMNITDVVELINFVLHQI